MAIPKCELDRRRRQQHITRRQFLDIVGEGGKLFLFAATYQVTAGRTGFNPLNWATQGLSRLLQAVADYDLSGSREFVVENASRAIQQFEKNVHAGEVSVDQAREIIPDAIKLFVAVQNSSVSSQELIESVLIIRSFDVAQLLRDYPGVRFSQTSLQKLRSNIIRNTGWVDDDGHILMNLPVINGTKSRDYTGLEYARISPQAECHALVPAVQFLSRATHEAAHRESGINWIPLAPTIRDQIKTLKRDVRFFQNSNPISKGFVIDYGKANYFIRLDELVADYRAAITMIRAGLPYSLAYPTPVELYNFQVILNQAQISSEELGRMHRTSALEEFMLRVAQGARNITFSSADEAIGFGVNNFVATEYDANLANILPSNGTTSRTLPLATLHEYYPSIDTKEYDYYGSTGGGGLVNGLNSGCIML